MLVAPTAAGPAPLFVPTATEAGAYIAVLPGHAATSTIGNTNIISAGHATLSSGTVTITFTEAYGTAPECTANGHTTANAMLVSSTLTTVTVTSSSGSDSQVVSWHCIPAAN